MVIPGRDPVGPTIVPHSRDIAEDPYTERQQPEWTHTGTQRSLAIWLLATSHGESITRTVTGTAFVSHQPLLDQPRWRKLTRWQQPTVSSQH